MRFGCLRSDATGLTRADSRIQNSSRSASGRSSRRSAQGCHGDKVKMGGLSLSSPRQRLADALNAGFIAKGEPEKSRLYRALLYTDTVKMPPTGKLPAEEIAAVRTWIEAGAAFPQSSAPVSAGPSGVTAQDRQHWAFQPIQKHQPPTVKNLTLDEESDRSVYSRETRGETDLTAMLLRAKHTLLRRVTYDLTGLPPTPEDIDSFVADKSPDAFAKGCRPAACLSALRRTLGTSLARCRALCRLDWDG